MEVLFPKKRPISKTAMNILKKRYFSEGESSWEDIVNRVIEYVIPKAPERQKELTRQMMLNTYFIPNSPCLVNSGKKGSGLAACIPGETRIPTEKGMIKISEIVDKNIAEYVFDGEKKVKILGRKNSGEKEILEIHTQRGHILQLTGDHQILVYSTKKANSSKGWRLAKDLKEGDILEFGNLGSDFPQNKFDKNMAILLGYLYSDGCFTVDGRNGSRIIEFIVNSLEEAELLKKINKDFVGEDNLNLINNKEHIRLRGYGTERYRFLEKYQPFYSHICRVPDEIFTSNKDSISLFLSSLFSADGCVASGKKSFCVELSMSNEMFIRDVGSLLEMYGIRYSVYRYLDKRASYKRKENWKISILDKHSLSIFEKEIGFLNPQKSEKLKKYLLEKPLLRNQYHKNNLKLKIVKISNKEPCTVYDIQTESEKFLANNFVVHNCFVVDFPDNIEGIYKTKLDFALIARKGGGCGTSLEKIRPEGSKVAGSTHGYAGGGIKFADTISHDADALTQAGFRAMAIMFTESVYHPDILKFINAKEEEGRIANANISVIVDDAFMEKVINNETYWTEFNGEKYQEYNARVIFDLIVEGMWRNGEPGVLFRDRINDSPYSYTSQEIFSTNPCSEQPLPPNGVCNLGSLDLSKFLYKKEIEWGKLEIAVRNAVRFLDAVVDISGFPTEGIDRWAKENRAIGLGIMGYADLCLMMEIAYGSQEALDVLSEILSYIYTIAEDESRNLGVEKGVPLQCAKLPLPRRNITLTTIAPTGTISLIAGCSSGIEPVFSEITVRNDKTGTYTFENSLADKPYFRCAVSSNGAQEVTWEEHINTLATAQKHIDSGVSKTINFPTMTHRDTIGKAVIMAWKEGCKGLAVYRNGSRKQEVLTPKNIKKDKCPVCGNDLVMIDGKMKCTVCKFDDVIEKTIGSYDS